MVYFQVHLKYKQFEGKGTGPCSVVTVETWDGHDREEDMHNSAVWKNVKPKKQGAKWMTLQQSKRHTVRKWLTPDKII